MTTAPFTAEIRNYADLIEAMCARKAELGLSDAHLDELSGLAKGHSGKVLSPSWTRGIGPVTLGRLLGTLSMKFVAVVDDHEFAQMQAHYQKRVEVYVRPRYSKRVAIDRRIMQELGRAGGHARMFTMTPEERSAVSRANIAKRWDKQKRKRRPKAARRSSSI